MDKHAGHILIPLAASMFLFFISVFIFHIGFLELDMCDLLMEGAPSIEAISKLGKADALRWDLRLTGDVNSK